MGLLFNLIRWEVLLILMGLAGFVASQALSGQINTKGMFCGVKGDGTQYFSPERVQLLLFTLAAAFQYLTSVLNDQTRFPDVPWSWLMVLGGSHVVYLGGKFGASLIGKS